MAMEVPPIAEWFVRENLSLEWMMTRGTPICGNPQMSVIELNSSGNDVVNHDEP